MKRLLVEDVTIVTMDADRRVIPNGAIVVDGGVITYVGAAGGLPAGLPEMPRIPGRGRVAIPGFVNAHTHAAMVLFRGYADDLPLQEWLETKIFPIEARLTPEDVYWGTLLACAEMIKSGTTAFADMYFFMDQAATAVERSGMRAALAEGLTSVNATCEAALARGSGFCERWHGTADGRITTMLAPHAPYTCSKRFMGMIAARAAELGVGVHTHISETFRENDDITREHGMSPTEFIESSGLFEVPVLAAHCVYASDSDMDIFRKHKVRVAHNPGSNMKLASGVAPVPEMLKKGLDVGLGTDGASSNNNLDMVEETRLASLLQKVVRRQSTAMRAQDCLELATRGGAACLGLADSIGSLEVGKKADIVLFDFHAPHLAPSSIADPVSHIVYAASGSDVTTVIIDGVVVMDERKLTTIDEDDVIAQVNERAVRLASEVAQK